MTVAPLFCDIDTPTRINLFEPETVCDHVNEEPLSAAQFVCASTVIGAAVGTGVLVRVGVGVGVFVRVGVGVNVGVRVAVAVFVAVFVNVGVAVAVFVGVGVEVDVDAAGS